MAAVQVPAHVLQAFGFEAAELEPINGGLINASFALRDGRGKGVAVLQRLHPIFAAEVNLDIEAVTDHVAAKGLVTPRLLRTREGEAWVESDGIWRALSFVEGQCYQKLPSAHIAEAGGALVASFHRATSDLDHRFHFQRAGVHDTAAHLAGLRSATMEEAHALRDGAERLRDDILAAAADIPAGGGGTTRLCHGDLKISNLLFDDEGNGVCLIDLDTMGAQSMAYELGDALRSWANPAGEDVAEPCVDSEVIAAAATGYARGAAGLLERGEVESVIWGLETICIELAARFCRDIFEDSYFGWDATRFQSRREHNLVRAKGQLALGRSVGAKRSELETLWRAPFAS